MSGSGYNTSPGRRTVNEPALCVRSSETPVDDVGSLGEIPMGPIVCNGPVDGKPDIA